MDIVKDIVNMLVEAILRTYDIKGAAIHSGAGGGPATGGSSEDGRVQSAIREVEGGTTGGAGRRRGSQAKAEAAEDETDAEYYRRIQAAGDDRGPEPEPLGEDRGNTGQIGAGTADSATGARAADYH